MRLTNNIGQLIVRIRLLMEENLISKKELLKLTNISYGQLYRWKRKNLIPESWFIRKSTFTGQETFFPRDKIVNRVKKIMELKNELSLDELSDMFSNNSMKRNISINEIYKKNIVSKYSIELFKELYGKIDTFEFKQVVCIYIIDKLLNHGNINIDESKIVLDTIIKNFDNFKDKSFNIYVLRKFGVLTCEMVESSALCVFDSETKLIENISAEKCIEEIKSKLIV